jgi:5-methylcytosine-specific restriction enzyme A
MSRSVPEWIGKTDDAKIPDRVKLRVFDAYGGRCAGCDRKLYPGDRWEADHIKALINGGQHRENNLQPLCEFCHPEKTRADVAEKAMIARKRKKHVGIRTAKRKLSGRGFAKSEPQHSATRPIEKE